MNSGPWSDARGLRRLAQALAQDRGLVIVAVASAVVLAAATALYPVALELMTVQLMGAELPARWTAGLEGLGISQSEGASRLAAYVWPAFVGLVVTKGAAQALHVYTWNHATQRAVCRLRTKFFGRLLIQSPGFFAQRSVGDLAGRFAGDIDDVERALHAGLPVLVFDALRFLALAAVAVVHYPGLVRVALVVFVVAVIPIITFARWLRRHARHGQQARGTMLQRVVEAVGGIAVIHAFDAKTAEAGRFARAQNAYLNANLRMIRLRALHSPLMELIGVAAILATIQVAVGAHAVVSPSEAVGFLLAMVLMYEPLKNLGRVNAALVPGLSAFERLHDVIDRRPEIDDPPHAQRWPAPPREARFSNVWFRYHPEGNDVLRGFDMALQRGRIIGLVGPSGSGKTTVASLLPRLYDVTQGAVLIGGVDVRQLPLAALRSRVAVVTQDAFLFNASIRDNIAYGLSDASDDAVVRAAMRARAHSFIEALPGGYAATCGDRGVRLSGGQRQRLAIARAFLKDAPFLILDEATSALDAANERAVQAALLDLMDDRAVLLIAHRSSMLDHCDEIVVLDEGRAGAEVSGDVGATEDAVSWPR